MTPDDISAHHLCPVCNGVKRFLNSLSDNVVLDPELLKHPPGEVWTKEFWVCAACLGQGTLTAHNARVLSGDYPPPKVRTIP